MNVSNEIDKAIRELGNGSERDTINVLLAKLKAAQATPTTVWAVYDDEGAFFGVYATPELAKADVEVGYKERYPNAEWIQYGEAPYRTWAYALRGKDADDSPAVYVEECTVITE